FYLAFCTSKKQAVRPDGTGHPVPLTAHLLKRQGAAQLHKKSHYPGRDRASSAVRGTLIKKARCCAAAQKRQRAAQLHKKGNVPRSCTHILPLVD
ncbi:hypothetical protein D7Y41_32280, partial [Anaerotruncus sp. 1XD22-93]